MGTGGRLAGYGRTCEPSRHASRAGRTQGRLRRSSFVARALRAGTEALASQPTAGLAPPWREWPRKRPGYAVHNFELQPRCGCRPGMLHSWAPPAALSACSPWRRRWQQVSPCSGTRPWLRPSLPSRPSSAWRGSSARSSKNRRGALTLRIHRGGRGQRIRTAASAYPSAVVRALPLATVSRRDTGVRVGRPRASAQLR